MSDSDFPPLYPQSPLPKTHPGAIPRGKPSKIAFLEDVYKILTAQKMTT